MTRVLIICDRTIPAWFRSTVATWPLRCLRVAPLASIHWWRCATNNCARAQVGLYTGIRGSLCSRGEHLAVTLSSRSRLHPAMTTRSERHEASALPCGRREICSDTADSDSALTGWRRYSPSDSERLVRAL